MRNFAVRHLKMQRDATKQRRQQQEQLQMGREGC